MARLIDADALLENVKRGVYTDDLGTTIAVDICKSHIEKMPTVAAITVEWLEEMKHWAAADGDNECVLVIAYLLDRWQKEQEAR